MRTPIRMLAVFALLTGITYPVGADDADRARAIIVKAIKAEGGEERLAKVKAGVAKTKGTLSLQGQRINISSEDYYQLPNRIKTVMTLEVPNMPVTVTTVFNQDKLWIQTQGQTMEVKDANLLDEIKHQLYVGKVGLLFPLLQPGFQLTTLPEIQIDGRAAIGVGVAAKGQRDVKIYFDKKTNLTAKLESRAYNLARKEVKEEKFYHGYRQVDGLSVPSRVVVHRDGQEFMEVEVTEFRLLEKLDEATFARP